ncbi:MAG: hypothetical protein VX641_00315 [Planctomycetota bacterium]|nr:hypothetical protein [Planctomycetota bacterium]
MASPLRTAAASPDATGHGSVIATLGWGIYSASSWTWCIGMFLPIVLMKYLGWWGFLIFAVPNVLGVVAFGYLFDADASRRMLARHRSAIRLFSVVTVGYQLFFIAWIMSGLMPESGGTTAALVAIGVWLVGLTLAALPDRGWVVLGVLAWVVSIGLFGAFLVENGPGLLETRPGRGLLEPTDALALAPAIVFGFLLCPWLDGSFHRARIRSGSPHTFLIFAIAFVPMILFTVAYASGGAIAVNVLVVIQLLLQATFTTAVHLREAWLGGLGAARDRARPWPWAALLPVLCILLGTLPWFANEATYLRFLGFYGLVFPAFVLLFMSPLGSLRTSGLPLLVVAVLLVPCGIAYEQAFIDHQTRLVPFAVAGLLGLAILIGFTGGPTRSS